MSIYFCKNFLNKNDNVCFQNVENETNDYMKNNYHFYFGPNEGLKLYIPFTLFSIIIGIGLFILTIRYFFFYNTIVEEFSNYSTGGIYFIKGLVVLAVILEIIFIIIAILAGKDDDQKNKAFCDIYKDENTLKNASPYIKQNWPENTLYNSAVYSRC